ncbi:MAG: DUF5407 family protein [Parachlamydiaceae bacterium]|nr:DUF5407 family protein [Parachlamydiaceae bacterium]
MANNASDSPKFYGLPTGGGQHAKFQVQELFNIVNTAVLSAKGKLGAISSNRSSINIGDMFEMQMLMNKLSQVSEMATNVVAAGQTAVMSMARNVKG